MKSSFLAAIVCAGSLLAPVTVHSSGTPAGSSASGLPSGGALSREAVAKVVGSLLEQARGLEEEALRKNNGDEERAAMLERAVSVLTRALTLDPHAAEARVDLGRILSEDELGEDAVRRSARELYRARQDDPIGVFACDIAQLLGIVLSRLGQFQQAVAEYDRAIQCLPGQPGSPLRQRIQRATLLGNSAEAMMAMGRLTEAIARYSQAEAIEVTDQAALHSLGLAVAYDRDGQGEKSRDALTRSLTTDPALKLFQGDSVFFVPAGDRSYYMALLAESFDDRETALSSWQRFLRELPQSRYAARARAHLDELRRTPGLSAAELYRAEVIFGEPLFPPDRQAAQLLGRKVRGEEDVEKTAQAHMMELRQCYGRALRKDAKLAGDVEIAVVLERSGAVALAEVIRNGFAAEERTGGGAGPDKDKDKDGKGAGPEASPSQAARELVRCAADSMRRWRFPAADLDHDELALPLRFEIRR